MSLQDILAQTVQEALAEREDTIIEEEPPRRGLFSRRKMRDTEQLYDDAEEEEEEEDVFDEAELDLPEPPLQETLADYRAQLSGAVKARRGAGIFTLALCVMALLEHFSILPAAYVEDPMIRALPLLAADCDLLVSATPLGMAGQEEFADFRFLENCHGWVYDLVYQPRETALLAAAQDRGLPVIGGLALLHAQAELAFELFVGE